MGCQSSILHHWQKWVLLSIYKIPLENHGAIPSWDMRPQLITCCELLKVSFSNVTAGLLLSIIVYSVAY